MTAQQKITSNSNFVMPPDPLELQEESLDQLKKRAEALGIEIMEGEEKAEIIEAIIEASVNEVSSDVTTDLGEVEAGMLFSLHSRDEDAKQLILEARNRIYANENATPPRLFRLFLQDKDKNFYSRTVPGVRVSKERLPSILRIVTLPPDGSQSEAFEDFKANPDKYQQPVLVRLRRRNKDGTTGNYVMLYVRKKSSRTTEQVF